MSAWRSGAVARPPRTDDLVDRVRDASDIVHVVGEVVALKARGREFVGLCPFHDDHNPSMCVVPAKGIFHCFVCGAGGDVFSFVRRFHAMEFREALEHLAQKAGIEIPEHRAAEAPSDEITRADLVRANTLGAEFFSAILRHADHGRRARELLERRGVSPEMIEQFRLGASPDRWDGLALTARSRSTPEPVLVKAGLLKLRDAGGGVYDAFRDRLMFPIHDQVGRVIAFGGRRINDQDEPKYLNSAESPIFSKSQALYAIHHAARAIQTSRTAIVVEGYMDAIACHQAGVRNAVATLGTALTPAHARALRRLCERVVLIFDGDEAGARAADRAIEALFAEPIDVRVCVLKDHTDAKDPDELLKREGGLGVFQAAVEAAPDLLEYRFARLKARLAGSGPAAVSRAVEEEIQTLARLGLAEVAPIRRHLIVRQLAKVAGVSERVVGEALSAARIKARPGGGPATTVSAALPVRLSPRQMLLGIALVSPQVAREFADRVRLVDPAHLSPPFSTVAEVLREAWSEGRDGLQGVLASLERSEGGASEAAVALSLRVESESGGDGDRLRAAWADCAREVALESVRDRPRAESDLEAKIRLMREQHEVFGADRRVIPRTGG